MEKILIGMTSITYAMKARQTLNNHGYYCEIERTPKNLGSGCGYSIIIKDDPERIMKILDNNGINHKNVL